MIGWTLSFLVLAAVFAIFYFVEVSVADDIVYTSNLLEEDPENPSAQEKYN